MQAAAGAGMEGEVWFSRGSSSGLVVVQAFIGKGPKRLALVTFGYMRLGRDGFGGDFFL
jgi:hypothetical protein